jgi:hypothetical protein
MNWTKLSVATTMAAALIASPATAYADCGDPGQDPCTGRVPTTDAVLAVLANLADSNIPAANKADIVAPAFSPEEAQSVDDHLRRLSSRGYGPYNFVVTDIEPAPTNFAGATMAIPLGPWLMPGPIVLVEHGGHWLITDDSARDVLHSIWHASFPKGLGPRWTTP